MAAWLLAEEPLLAKCVLPEQQKTLPKHKELDIKRWINKWQTSCSHQVTQNKNERNGVLDHFFAL